MVITAERFARGMTFDEYVAFTGTAENLAREGSTNAGSAPRRDWSAYLRERYLTTRLTAAQAGSIAWLAKQPGGPAKVLVISEDWSSDCRRDVPPLQRLPEAGGMELRIFTRDGKSLLQDRPNPADSPNADLMLAYMNRRDGKEFASIPVAVFFDRDFRELHRYVEFPAIYHKDAIVGNLRARGGPPGRAFFAMLETPLYDVWADAAIDEIISALFERSVLAGGPAS